MVTRSLSKLAAAAGGLALSVLAGAGIASADPDLGAAINTTCSYPQVVAALNAQSPAAHNRSLRWRIRLPLDLQSVLSLVRLLRP